MPEKRYNTYIISNSGEAQALIGVNLNIKQAEKREMTGLTRIDRDNYFVASYKVGSVRDEKNNKDLKNK